MTWLEALTLIDSEIRTRISYGATLAAAKPPKPNWVIDGERERLGKMRELRGLIAAQLEGELNAEARAK